MARLRQVDRSKYREYLKRADECNSAMKRSFDAGEWNACVICAIHAGIAAADALCVYVKGLRHAGERHEDAIGLFLDTAPGDDATKKSASRLSNLLGIKSRAEYGERLLGRKDAEEAVLEVERLLAFIKSRLPK